MSENRDPASFDGAVSFLILFFALPLPLLFLIWAYVIRTIWGWL